MFRRTFLSARPAAWLALLLLLPAGPLAAATVHYTLQDVVLEEGRTMTGTFAWTYVPGDFENGSGVFLSLSVPYTYHDETDLQAVFDMGGSIEITYPGNVHDDGVDITLFLQQPLTPTTGAALDLSRSAYDIGGNGLHAGGFVSGSVQPLVPTDAGDTPAPAVATALQAGPNPFNPLTVLAWEQARPAAVRLEIRDLVGRRLRVLADGETLPAGRHALTWRGRDDAGRPVAAGVYLARLVAGRTTRVVKLQLVK